MKYNLLHMIQKYYSGFKSSDKLSYLKGNVHMFILIMGLFSCKIQSGFLGLLVFNLIQL